MGIEAVDLSTTDSVASGGGSSGLEIDVPEGYVYQLLAMYISIPDPVGSTSGSHNVTLQCGTLLTPKMKGLSDSGTNIRFTNGAFDQITTKTPNDDGILNDILFGSVYGDPVEKMRFLYVNSTDANQTGNRQIKCVFKKYRTL